MNQGPALRAAILSLVLLAGCAAPADQHNPTPTPAPSSAADTLTRANDPAPIGDEDMSPPRSPTSTSHARTNRQIDEHSGETVTASRRLMDSRRGRGPTAATKAMKTFARPHPRLHLVVGRLCAAGDSISCRVLRTSTRPISAPRRSLTTHR